jgi:hypothetical protein
MGTYDDLLEVISELRRQNAVLGRRNAELEKTVLWQQRRIEALEEQLKKLRRQGKRQAAPFSKGSPKSDPKRPGRKPGKRYGVQTRREIPRRVEETIEVDCPLYLLPAL